MALNQPLARLPGMRLTGVTLRSAAAAAMALLASACMSIGTFNRLTPHDPGAVRAAHNVRYGEAPRNTLDVYVPQQRPHRAPVIVFYYGGGWSSGNKEDYSFVGSAFASRGFVTVVPDYRIYPEVQFPAFVEDAAAALRWVNEDVGRYGGDPNRIVIVGHSAGAHIGALAALDSRYSDTAAFDRRAIRGIVGLAGPYGFRDFEDPLLHNVFGDVRNPARTMPVNYVRRDAPPLLLLHGDRDTRVPPFLSQLMHERAVAAGQSAELEIYGGVDHAGIVQALAIARRDEAPVLQATIEFARRVTGQTMAEFVQTDGS